MFQKRINHLLGDLPGVETDIDDTLVWGSSQEEHDEPLKAVLNRCEQINLTLNKEKCQFTVSEVSYIDHILNTKGVQPDPEKVRAIQDMLPPVDKKGGQTTRYYQLLDKIHTEHVDIIHPICELLKSDTKFDGKNHKEKLSMRSSKFFLPLQY